MKPITFSPMSRWIQDHISFYWVQSLVYLGAVLIWYSLLCESCCLSALKLYGVCSRPANIHQWKSSYFIKRNYFDHATNYNSAFTTSAVNIFLFNKIRESNMFWHFLVSEVISSSCQRKTIITTHTNIIALAFNVNSLATVLNALWELENTGI